MTEAAEGQGPWCSECDEPVKRVGARAVHLATGETEAADESHEARATFVSPQMRADAREVEAEFKGRWTIDTSMGFFDARRAGVMDAQLSVTADTKDELRAKLKAAENVSEWAAKDEAARQARIAGAS